MASKQIRTNIQMIIGAALALSLASGCGSADAGQEEELGEHRAALEAAWYEDQFQFNSDVAELDLAVVEASRGDTFQPGDHIDVGIDQAIEAQGQDFPGEKCIRNDGEESSTSGKCENVCKDKEVYSPHPSEDPAGTFGVCKGEAKKQKA